LRALLDTHVFLWWATNSPELSRKASDFIGDPDNSLLLSVVSAWEILLKVRTGRLPIPGDAARFIETHAEYYGFAFLEMRLAHLIGFHHLPAHHRDPFDHMLIAQAQVENLPLVTGDAQIAKYDVELIW
jgi:PIN domain nuclease of toxin-antitoxin system